MKQKPEDYLYSSYRSYIGGHPESIVSPDAVLEMLTVKRSQALGRYRHFVESVMGGKMPNPLQGLCGGVILGSKRFIKDALDRVKHERLQNPAVSHSKALRSTLGIEKIISACCEYFGVTREEITHSRRSQSRKACIYPIKKHMCATNRETAEPFRTLSYLAVSKISGNVSKQLAVDKELGEEIERLEVNFSFFKPLALKRDGKRPFRNSCARLVNTKL